MKKVQVNPHQGMGRLMPPLFSHVEIYFLQKGCSSNEAAAFLWHYRQRGWKGIQGRPAPNWKTLACDWTYLIQQSAYQRKKNTV